MQIELNGYTLTANGTQLHIKGPDADACNEIGQAFLELIKTEDGFTLITQYAQVRNQLIEDLGVPTTDYDNPALDRLIDWLREHPELIDAVEEALEPHGYDKTG